MEPDKTKQYICFNDDEFNCGVVQWGKDREGTKEYPITTWVHTGEPSAPDLKKSHWCDSSRSHCATPSNLVIA